MQRQRRHYDLRFEEFRRKWGISIPLDPSRKYKFRPYPAQQPFSVERVVADLPPHIHPDGRGGWKTGWFDTWWIRIAFDLQAPAGSVLRLVEDAVRSRKRAFPSLRRLARSHDYLGERHPMGAFRPLWRSRWDPRPSLPCVVHRGRQRSTPAGMTEVAVDARAPVRQIRREYMAVRKRLRQERDMKIPRSRQVIREALSLWDYVVSYRKQKGRKPSQRTIIQEHFGVDPLPKRRDPVYQADRQRVKRLYRLAQTLILERGYLDLRRGSVFR
jgi:hypothetical protein